MGLAKQAQERFDALLAVLEDCSPDILRDLQKLGLIELTHETYKLLILLDQYEQSEGTNGPNTCETLNILWVNSRRIRQLLTEYAQGDI